MTIEELKCRQNANVRILGAAWRVADVACPCRPRDRGIGTAQTAVGRRRAEQGKRRRSERSRRENVSCGRGLRSWRRWRVKHPREVNSPASAVA
jgi:hypothetical protein